MLMLIFMDFALVNADIYYYMDNPEKKSNGNGMHHHVFFESVADSLISMNWAKYQQCQSSNEASMTIANKEGSELEKALKILGLCQNAKSSNIHSSSSVISSTICMPKHLKAMYQFLGHTKHVSHYAKAC